MAEREILEEDVENPLDDFQSSDLDINSLKAKFIDVIDKYRSRNSPNVIDANIDQPLLNETDELKESRAHCFYRILGLPTITPNGKFYSPGFNQFGIDRFISKTEINNAIPGPIKEQIQKREDLALERRNFFKGSSSSPIYAISMSDPQGQRPFMQLKKDINGLEEPDEQKTEINSRKLYVSSRYTLADGSDITTNFSSVTHILRPFMTDPVIESNLSPSSGASSVLVSAPFIEKEDRKLDSGYARLPGIEFVLRLRLRQQVVNDQIEGELDLSAFGNIISDDRQREIAATLTNVGVSDADVSQVLNGTTLVELYTLNDLVKTFKGLVNKLVENIEILERVYSKIIWVPTPNPGGPEKGSTSNTQFVIPKIYLDTWEIDRKIVDLTAKNVIAKSQAEIGDGINFSDFTISEFQNVNNVFNDTLEEQKDERERLEALGSNALRTVELISGEISGLGLIDIFAIYMAMWSLPVSTLLNLIDDQAVERLSKIKELQTGDVNTRKNGGADPIAAYQDLENRIISILSYADRLFVRARRSPDEIDGGDIERN